MLDDPKSKIYKYSVTRLLSTRLESNGVTPSGNDLDNNSKKSVRPTLRVQDILKDKINVPFTIPKSTKIDEAISYLVKNRLTSVIYSDNSFSFFTLFNFDRFLIIYIIFQVFSDGKRRDCSRSIHYT